MRSIQLGLRVALPAALGVVALVLLPDLIAVREAPTAPPPYAAEPGALPAPAGPKAGTRAATAPGGDAALDPEPDQDPEERFILSEASRLLEETLRLEAELPRDWRADYDTEAQLVVSSGARGRWVTLSAARVPCDRVDRTLARRSGKLGRPDRCARWIERTRQTLARHGVDSDPLEFLREQGIEPDVRVLVVYAGWERKGEGIALVAARPAPVYPEIAFDERRREALDGVYRSLGLGPYARE